MTDFDNLARKVKELEIDMVRLRHRVSRLEEYIETNMDPPPVRVEVIPPTVVARAAEMGAALAEAKQISKSSRDSARGLRRVVSPEDDTGKFPVSKAK